MSGAGVPSALTVLHVTQPGDGGVARCVSDAVDDQVARGWRVAVAAPDETPLARSLRSGGSELWPWRATRDPGTGVVNETRSLSKIVARIRPDIVHLHSSKAGLAGRLALRGDVPTIFQPHNWSFEAIGGALRVAAAGWERFATRWADVIVCVSEGERELGLQNRVRGAFVVIANGVDLARFTPTTPEERRAARALLGLSSPTVLCVGRLSRAKGQDVLVEAWPPVRECVPDARLYLVGQGEDEPRLRAIAGAGVVFVGLRSDVPDWLAAADVVVIPSRWEAMSLGMLEAMARGCSIVATDVPGAREALAQGRGALVPVENPRALAAAVIERLRDEKLRSAEGGGAARAARASYDLRVTLERTATLYADCLGARSATRR